MAAILRDGVESGPWRPSPTSDCPPRCAPTSRACSDCPGFEGLPPALLARGMGAWAALFGLISFELFGRLTNAVHDDDAWFDYQLRQLTRTLGL